MWKLEKLGSWKIERYRLFSPPKWKRLWFNFLYS